VHAAIEAEVEKFASQGLVPVVSTDLRSYVGVEHIEQPALLVNARAHVSVLASASFALAHRVAGLLDLAQLCPGEGVNFHEALESIACMAREAAALAEIVANHPSVTSAAEYPMEAT
jgi:hypothetical protein